MPYDNMYPGWEPDYLAALGAKATPGNIAFFDWWHHQELSDKPEPLNPFSEGGHGGFLEGRTDVKPWYNANWISSSLAIAGFTQKGYGAFDTAKGIEVLTPDIAKMLRGEPFSEAAAASEIGGWGTHTAQAAIAAGTAPGEGKGAAGKTTLPSGGGAGAGAGCHSSGFTVDAPPKKGGDFTGVPCSWYPQPAQGTNNPSGAYPGTMNKAGTECCVATGASQNPPLTGQPGTTSGNGCVCISIPSAIPIIGGDLKTCLLPQPACDFFSAITSETFWIRAGEVILGLILLVIGLRMLIGRPSAALSGAKTAARNAVTL